MVKDEMLNVGTSFETQEYGLCRVIAIFVLDNVLPDVKEFVPNFVYSFQSEDGTVYYERAANINLQED